jgi:hypothetical protein
MQVNGETRVLSYEVKGELDLLVDDSSRKYNLFIKKNEIVKKLTEDNYLALLSDFASDKDIPEDDLRLNLRDIRNFVLDYNAKFDSKFDKTPPVSVRLRLLGGVSNYNAFLPQQGNDDYNLSGISFELYNQEKFNRHSLLLQVRKNFDSGDIHLDVWEIGIGYRSRLINTEKFHLYF